MGDKAIGMHALDATVAEASPAAGWLELEGQFFAIGRCGGIPERRARRRTVAAKAFMAGSSSSPRISRALSARATKAQQLHPRPARGGFGSPAGGGRHAIAAGHAPNAAAWR